jgi:hypothetical protein
MYTASYWTMQSRNLVSDGRNRTFSNYDPYAVGTPKGRLLKLADGSHYDAMLSEREQALLRLWIETSATYPGTYASLGCGFYPVHLSAEDKAALRQRCAQCHLRETYDKRKRKKVKIVCLGRQRGGLGPIYNLDRPAKSLLVRAMLAKKASGLALGGKVVFKTTQDPLYQSLLARVREASDRLKEGKRFDMPGFRPSKHYVREMQRFGILARDLDPAEPIDYYALDRAYWRSFWHQPTRRSLP